MHYAEFAFATFRNMLGMLDQVLAKAEASPAGDALLSARLADDMFPLARQVTVIGWQVEDMLARCGATTGGPRREDDPQTLAQARERLAADAARLDGIDAGLCKAEDEPVDFDLPMGIGFVLTAGEYVRDWAIPQFYFHVMTAYAILRHEGIEIGKRDYVPYMVRYAKDPSLLRGA